MGPTSILLAAVVAVLAGCAELFNYEGNENSPLYRVPVGSRLTLHQELLIPAEQVGVFIQDGHVVPSSEIKKYTPHCKFELYTRHETPRTVAPDEFTVTRTVQEETHSVDAGSRMVARAGVGMRTDLDTGGPSIQIFATRMHLRSAKQPDVFRLSCAQWGYPPQDGHVTIAEIRRALGPIMTLDIPRRSAAAN